MRSEAKTIDEYITELEPTRRESIDGLRSMILKHAPDIDQSMDLGMPVFRFGDGKFDFVALASQEQYMSFYVNPEVLAKHKSKFKGVNLGKSCVRFRRLGQLSLEDIELLLKDALEVS
ncbi:MAG: iron chaperone [Candidatus Thorarchaeota archaeon]|jgi:uncharacterized protein YdhG (YjbR/CyaY superfamily)